MIKALTISSIAFVLALCCGLHGVAAQSISGRVVDDADGKPVAGASITIKGSTMGTASDAGGFFRLSVTALPAVLVVSRLGFHSEEVTVNKISDDLVIAIEAKTYPLPAPVIKPHPVAMLMKTQPLEILDYEFLGGRIILLANRNGSEFMPCLVLAETGGDTIATLDVRKPYGLYRDFENNVYFLSRLSAFQISYGNNEITLSYVMSREEFRKTYPAVVYKNSPDWVLRRHQYKNQVLDYFSYSETDDQYDLFCSISNDDAIARAEWGSYFDGSEADAHFASVIINRPVFAPMFHQGDSLILFNYLDRKIVFFDQLGNELGSVKAGFMRDKTCREAIYKDEITGRFYVLFLKNGISTLHQIDLHTGNTGFYAKIPDFVFVERINVYNKDIYFLYREKSGSEQKKLYVMEL